MYNVLCFRKMIPANKYVINFHNLIMYHISSHLLSYYWFVYHVGYLLCDVYYIVLLERLLTSDELVLNILVVV